MKKITFAVPCYNSAAYMEKCVDSILTARGEDVEILLVDDGSKDETAAIADGYAARFPGIVRAIHQENRGHGGAVMTGLREAQGEYFKVVDSDDWLGEEALGEVMAYLRGQETPVDMVVCNYIYDKVGVEHKRVISYENALPTRRVMGWEQTHGFRIGQYMLMHAIVYRTALLRESGMELPLHTFYVDNLFVYVPMAKVQTMYYLPCNLYHYFIGREDQSVHESVMIRRIDQQLLVNRLMAEQVNPLQVENRRAGAYMFNYLEIITAVTCMMITISDTAENYEKREKLWQSFRELDERLYKKLRRGILAWGTCMKTRAGRRLSIALYHIANRIFGFN